MWRSVGHVVMVMVVLGCSVKLLCWVVWRHVKPTLQGCCSGLSCCAGSWCFAKCVVLACGGFYSMVLGCSLKQCVELLQWVIGYGAELLCYMVVGV